MLEEDEKEPTLDDCIGRLYVSGWLKRGPTGIIASNLVDAKQTVQSLVDDLSNGTGGRLVRTWNVLRCDPQTQTRHPVGDRALTPLRNSYRRATKSYTLRTGKELTR